MLTRDSFRFLRHSATTIKEWYRNDASAQSVNSILLLELCEMSEQLYAALTGSLSEDEKNAILDRYGEIFNENS